MYRLMVVEDEEMIRKGIVRSVPWNELGFVVAAEGRNGKDALEKMKNAHIDVILTDIKMPIMGGIEFSKEVRRQYPNIEIVVLSGFSDFEYARQAIRFRAFEYLLKPTNKKKLLETFKDLKEKMDKKKELKEEGFFRGVFLDAGYDSLRNDFLTSLLNGEQRVFDHMEDQMSTLELNFSGKLFTAAIIRFDKNSIYGVLEGAWEKDKKLLLFSYRNIINEVLGEMENGYAVVKEYDEINFIFCFDSKEEQDRQMIRCLENISDYIQSCLFGGMEISCIIGIGLTYPSILQISKSFHQAQRSILNNFYKEEQMIQVFQDHSESQYEQSWIQYYPEEMQGVAVCVSNGNEKETKRLLKKMFQSMINLKVLPDIVKNYCIVLKLMITSKVSLDDSQEDTIISRQYTEIVRNSLSVQDLEEYVTEILVKTAAKIDGITDSNEHHLAIEKAKEYIQEHYDEKITLKRISDEVYLSQNYFSFLFKKAAGMTYMDYIQSVRMREAKKILADPVFKIYEIAKKIGYNDYKYFAIQFKKLVGMTPKEYRRQLS